MISLCGPVPHLTSLTAEVFGLSSSTTPEGNAVSTGGAGSTLPGVDADGDSEDFGSCREDFEGETFSEALRFGGIFGSPTDLRHAIVYPMSAE